jgi:glycosyltransferase involved in cell wall biosynthesis
MPLADRKIAIFYAFFKCRGGGEKLIFALRNHLQADLWAGSINFDEFNQQKTDSFSQELFSPNYQLEYLHKDGKFPGLMHLKRLWNLAFNNKIKELTKYDLVLISGNVFFVAERLKKLNPNLKIINYCNTPPRPFTDQEQTKAQKLPFFLHPLYKLAARIIRSYYTKDLKQADLIIANSQNIQNRLQKYLRVESQPIFVPVNTGKFGYLSTGDYYLSHSRLEDMKRIRLIVEAFADMPDKKLVICSTGPLEGWIKEQIKTRNLTNITFEGLVSDERLAELVGNCLTGITIPVDEDAGIVQCELMAAGKPVIGVAEGGLLETIVDGKTGFLLPANPTKEDLIQVVQELTPKKAAGMKEACIQHAKQYDESVFYEKIDQALDTIL